MKGITFFNVHPLGATSPLNRTAALSMKGGDENDACTRAVRCHALSLKKKPPRFCYDTVVPGAYLTVRETHCIKALLQTHSYRRVATSLGISYRTVESHIRCIRQKFRCKNKAALIALFQHIEIQEAALPESLENAE